ncbi:MAG: twin-arginine translocase subunit TatC [Paludibacteraceae bacterium]|nr:twin-arginine translocase subunit TatC [Paludibacteraceae bacterium]MBQ6764110.1 twin-arginine translocase subunit TatC [Paludibacteraceae bacterium]
MNSFWDHLDELRTVLLKSLCAWVTGTLAAFCCKDWVFAALMRPLGTRTLINIDVTAQFMTHIQVSLCVGFVVVLPLMVWWLYGFVAPGLYASEKHTAVLFVLGSVLLFAAGVALNYFLIFPLAFRFLTDYQVSPAVVNTISLGSYISLLLVLSVLMGLLFQVPVVTWLLSRLGLLSREHLKRYRGHVFVAILILAALVTPTGDPFTLLLVTLPVYALYELSILIIPRQALDKVPADS